MAQERTEHHLTKQQFFEACAVIEGLLDEKNSKAIGSHVQDSNAAAEQAIFEGTIMVDPKLNKTRCEPSAAGLRGGPSIQETFLAYQGLWPKERREFFRRSLAFRNAGTATVPHTDPQCATYSPAEAIPPPCPSWKTS